MFKSLQLISVVWLGRTHVEPKGRVGQDLDPMALHGALVEGGLPIEEDVVAVNHVSVHDVALPKIDHLGVDVAQRDHSLLLLDVDGLGAGVLDAVADVGHEPVPVVGRDNLGLGEVGGDLFGDAELVHVNIGVGRNDGPCGKVHPLAHEVAPHPTGLGAQAGLERLERAARALGGGGHALDVVVDVGGHVKLEVERVLLDIVSGLALVDLLTELLVAADNVDELVGEVVVHALVVVHDDGRTDGEGRDGEHGADHPGGAAVAGIKAENADGGFGHALKAAEDHLGLNGDKGVGVAGGLAVEGADGALDLFDLAQHGGAARGAGDGLLVVLGGLGDFGDGVFADGAEAVHARELRVEVLLLEGGVGGDDVEGRAAQADGVEGLDGKVEKLVEVDGPSESNVAKVTLALEVGVLAGGADATALDDAEPGVKHAAGDGVAALLGLVGDDFDDRPPEDLLGGSDAELDAYDRHCILICCGSNIFAIRSLRIFVG